MAAEQIKSKFGGTWEVTRSENFDAFLQEMGITTPVTRGSVTPRTEIKVEGDVITVHTMTGAVNRSDSFKLGQEYEAEYMGRKAKVVCSLEDGKMVTLATSTDGKVTRSVRDVINEEMYVEMRVGDVVSKRYLKRT